MGYTVYWNQSGNVVLADSADSIRELLDFCETGTKPSPHPGLLPAGMTSKLLAPPLAGPMGQYPPILTGKQLIFNGVGADMNESFYMDDVPGCGFCKTAEKPYGTAVKAALILMQTHCDDPEELLLSCDGSKMDWVQAMLILDVLFGFDPDDFIWSSSTRTQTERDDAISQTQEKAT